MNRLRTQITKLLFWLITRIGIASNVCTYTTVVRWSAEDQDYIATSPAFPGASGFGPTAHQALYELGVVIPCFIDMAIADGGRLPVDLRIASIQPPVIRPAFTIEDDDTESEQTTP